MLDNIVLMMGGGERRGFYLAFSSKSWVIFWMMFGMYMCGAPLSSIVPDDEVNVNGAISPHRLSPTSSRAICLICSSHAMDIPEAFNHLFDVS